MLVHVYQCRNCRSTLFAASRKVGRDVQRCGFCLAWMRYAYADDLDPASERAQQVKRRGMVWFRVPVPGAPTEKPDVQTILARQRARELEVKAMFSGAIPAKGQDDAKDQ